MATLTSIQDRNEQFLNELETYLRANKGNNDETLGEILKTIGEKYDIQPSNAQFLYYKKLKRKLDMENFFKKENKEKTVSKTYVTKEKNKYDDNLKDIITVNHKEVRVITHNNQDFVVAKDVLKSIGINSTSTHLQSVLTDTNKAIAPVKSTQGYAKTLVISVEACFEFLKLVIEKHVSKKLRSKAEDTIEIYRSYFVKNSEQTSLSLEELEKETSRLENPLEKVYRSGQKIQFKITHIAPRVVFGFTNDEYRTPASINIADVTNAFVSDLNDYFTKEDIIIANIKMYDAPKNQVYLTTRGLYAPKQRPVSVYELKNKIPAEPKKPISITVEESPEEKQDLSIYSIESVEEIPVHIEPVNELPSLSIEAQRELDAIIQLINVEARIGALSSEAKSYLIHLLNEKGIVHVITSIKDTADSFQPDLGVLFVRALDEQLKKVRL